MIEEKSLGLLLQSIPYLGRQKILKVFMPENGLVTLMAKSAIGGLDSPFCIGEWVYRKGQKEIHTLKDGALVDPLLDLRKNYECLRAAGSMAQDLLQTQLPAQSAPHLFDLACAYFKKLPLFAKPEILSASFRLKLLLQEGLLSLSAQCSRCSSPAFHLHQGESYCLAHAPFPGFTFTIEEWEALHLLAFARQFSLFQSLTQAPIGKINLLFQERIQN